MSNDFDDELVDFEEEPDIDVPKANEKPKEEKKGHVTSINSSGFKDFLLKPELLRAVVDCGFEHPSEGNYKTHFVW